ncbi:MAG: phosphoenolpyruvate synthase [Candidatus Babeliaceae bacterium]|nr:phosphoenolpyruvate synthase [Candidatus Babeliaceae bacterium]
MKYIRFFSKIGSKDVALVGGKNASLGELSHLLAHAPLQVPPGFSITADAYREHLKQNDLEGRLATLLKPIGRKPDVSLVQEVGAKIRDLIRSKPLPPDVAKEIVVAYETLSQQCDEKSLAVAVRSSATAEDMPEASFAGQHETYLYIVGSDALLQACLNCMASLFTDRAIVYRREKGFDDLDVALAIGVQKMVAADDGASGVLFTLEPDTGSSHFIAVNSVYGLGETIVQGQVTPDEWLVHKGTLRKGFRGIVRQVLGVKDKKMVFNVQVLPDEQKRLAQFPVDVERIAMLTKMAQVLAEPPKMVEEFVEVPEDARMRFSLSDDEVRVLAKTALVIEDHYSEQAGRWMPMDIEWARDGIDGKIYILQARPETVHSARIHETVLRQFSFSKKPSSDALILRGRSVGNGIVSGIARRISSPREEALFKEGDILITDMTDPDWVPLMRKASALVTNRGGRTCHAAIVSRELGVPALVGTEIATELIRDGEEITVECRRGSEGFVYRGKWPFDETEVPIGKNKNQRTYQLYVNIADPDEALRAALLPVDGVGLARLEFIITSRIGVHPMVCAEPGKIAGEPVCEEITERLGNPAYWAETYVERLAQAVAAIAAAFYPRRVVVRCTDFKSNEYRDLLGGDFFEPEEENPMLGFRGAARYIHEQYAPAFALECEALRRARRDWGMENIALLIPFVRSVEEAEAVVAQLAAYGLKNGTEGLELLMMVEVPQNVLSLEAYAPFFNGFSIGSNDLTQLTIGVDRDSVLVSHLFDERDMAVKQLLFMAIDKSKSAGKTIGICGQAPSDFPDLAYELIACGITSISLVPEEVPSFLRFK